MHPSADLPAGAPMGDQRLTPPNTMRIYVRRPVLSAEHAALAARVVLDDDHRSFILNLPTGSYRVCAVFHYYIPLPSGNQT